MDNSAYSAIISGPLLGRMIHERYRGHGTVGGILSGKIISHTVTEITDEKHIDLTNTLVCIQDYKPRSNMDLLKINSGRNAWEDDCDSITVGIFKVRKSTAQMSLLEKSAQRRLKKSLKPHEFGVMLLITCHMSEVKPSLSWKIAAYILQEKSFTPICLEISNLQGSLSGSYESCPRPLHCSHASNSLLHSLESSLASSADGKVVAVKLTRKTTEELMDKLSNAYAMLHKSEALLQELLAEKTSLLNIFDSV